MKRLFIVSGALVLCASSSFALAQNLAPPAMVLDRDCDGISWPEPAADTVSLNVHDSAGRYIATFGVDEREYQPAQQGTTVDEREDQCESGSVAGNVVDIHKTDSDCRFQMEFEFTGCVLNTVT